MDCYIIPWKSALASVSYWWMSGLHKASHFDIVLYRLTYVQQIIYAFFSKECVFNLMSDQLQQGCMRLKMWDQGLYDDAQVAEKATCTPLEGNFKVHYDQRSSSELFSYKPAEIRLLYLSWRTWTKFAPITWESSEEDKTQRCCTLTERRTCMSYRQRGTFRASTLVYMVEPHTWWESAHQVLITNGWDH